MLDKMVYHMVYKISIFHIKLSYYFRSEIIIIVCNLPYLDVLDQEDQGKPDDGLIIQRNEKKRKKKKKSISRFSISNYYFL